MMVGVNYNILTACIVNTRDVDFSHLSIFAEDVFQVSLSCLNTIYPYETEIEK